LILRGFYFIIVMWANLKKRNEHRMCPWWEEKIAKRRRLSSKKGVFGTLSVSRMTQGSSFALSFAIKLGEKEGRTYTEQ